jgi:PilZ domain
VLYIALCSMSIDLIGRMRDLVAECRRLAEETSDPTTAASLRKIANDSEADIATPHLELRPAKEHPHKKRDKNRQALTAEVNLRRSGVHPFRVTVFDLSPEGCKVEFVERPLVGERVWVKFDTLEALQASVRWVQGHIGGVQFDRPIHLGVFESLTRG